MGWKQLPLHTHDVDRQWFAQNSQMNRTELILKIVYWSAITLAAILKARSARRLARCLLPAFLCAHIFIKRETSGYEADFHRCCKQVTMWCKSLTLEKYMSFRMKWFFPPPFVPVSPFLLLNLVRRQCYAYAIGLYTRPEIKSWPDVKFCTHAQCVLPRCWYLGSAPF